MPTLDLQVTLRGDATLGRGDGVAGLVDVEVEHDASTGLPAVRGRTLKGLLVEECGNILWSLGAQGATPVVQERYERAALRLFGRPGSTRGDVAEMTVGDATLPPGLVWAVRVEVQAGRLSPAEVLESLTGVRRQTAVDEETGAPAQETLRAMRVVLRGVTFTSSLLFDNAGDAAVPPLLAAGTAERALLAACALGLRRLGMGRNRGRGLVSCRLIDGGADVTHAAFADFAAPLRGIAS